MSYAKQTWADGRDGGTPISAARLAHLEDGISAAVRKDELLVNVMDFGAVGDGTTDDTAAIETGMAAAAGRALYFPGGRVFVVAKAGRLSPIIVAYTALVGDPGNKSTIRFTHADGGIDVGNGADYVYQFVMRDLQLDGFNVATTVLRFRKSEESDLSGVRIFNAGTNCIHLVDTNLFHTRRIALSNSPVGICLDGATGYIALMDVNAYVVSEPVKIVGSGCSRLLISNAWVEACPDLVTIDRPGAAVSIGEIVFRDSYAVSTLANARLIRAIAASAVNAERIAIKEVRVNLTAATSPIVDFTAVDNSAGTVRFVLHAIEITAPAFGAQVLVKPHANQSWFLFHVDADRIRGVPTGQWVQTPLVTGGGWLRPLNLFSSGTPEGAVAAPVGSTYARSDGAAGTSFYVKQSGTGSTGWVAK